MQVLEKCAEKCDKDCKTVCIQSSGGSCRVFARDHYDREDVEAETLPIAICLFAKKLFSNE